MNHTRRNFLFCSSTAGFTLIELMITITILATLTALTAQAISQALKAKVKLQDQIDDVSRIRDAMRLVERDLNLSFHYRDLEKDLFDAIKKANNPNTTGQNNNAAIGTPANPFPGLGAGPTQPNTVIAANDPFATNRELPRKDPITQFVGANDSMNFVTSNNARALKNSQQADFIEVGYSLKDCKSLAENGGASKCLWRRSSTIVDDDVTKGGDEVVLLENISEFKLRYIGKGKQDWVNDWRSDDGGDGITKGKFPEAVEVSLTIEKKNGVKTKKYSMQNIISIHFPNNPEADSTTTSTTTGGTNGNPFSQQSPAITH